MDREKLSIFVNHGGKFVMLDNAMEYFGGDIHISHGIDIDRFGYLDLVDVVEKLGYVEVGKIYHKICGENGSVSYIHIHNDATLMEVIGSLQPNKFHVHLFVDNEKDGQKKASEESVINNAGEKGAGGTTDHSQMKKKEPRRKTPPAQNLVPQPSASENPSPAYTQTETAPLVALQSAMKQPIRKSPRLTQTEPTLNDHGSQIHKERNLNATLIMISSFYGTVEGFHDFVTKSNSRVARYYTD
ncbi:RING/U-box superfamily protein [Striga asiatica]|uniref:RING/U-box superfamily protein n=1 Tax=Striga asiatica TaxID=4170 RepID=A0A5A7PG87_STRAF|nr:RING/U-box superfamily protein [Striga asiatica]